MDCPICHERIQNSCVGGLCMHHFCYPCLFKWCATNVEKKILITPCPVCRSPIFEIRFDTQFDALCTGEKSANFKHPNEVLIEHSLDTRPGITMQNNIGPGVKIMGINNNGQFYKAGIRIGDIVLFINNIPCSNHKQAIYIINNTWKTGLPIKLNILVNII